MAHRILCNGDGVNCIKLTDYSYGYAIIGSLNPLLFCCRLCYVNSLPEHDGPVSVLATSPTLGDIATVCTTRPHKLGNSESPTASWLFLLRSLSPLFFRFLFYPSLHPPSLSFPPSSLSHNSSLILFPPLIFALPLSQTPPLQKAVRGAWCKCGPSMVSWSARSW